MSLIAHRRTRESIARKRLVRTGGYPRLVCGRDPHGSVKQMHHEELEDGDKERPIAFPKIMLKQTDSGIQHPHQLSSYCKNYPPEGAVFNEITQSLSRFDQRERLSDDRFDRAGLK